MKIGVDVDDVLIETFTAILNYHNQKFGSSYSFEDLTNYFVWELGIFKNKEHAIEEIVDYQKIEEVEKMVLCEGALEVVKELSENNELFIITSRHDVLKDKTREFINHYFKEIDPKIIHSGDFHGGKKPKAEICLEEGCKVIVEDRFKTAFECAEKGIKAILLNKPWNQSTGDHKNLIRVENWKEALEKIKEIEKHFSESILEKVKSFVKEECFKETSKYGKEPFEYHFVPMVNHAKVLARKKLVDEELIEIAAWLHDIGSIIHGRKDHHITGSKIAEEKLNEWGYPLNKIILIKKCILNHRGSQSSFRESVEEQIIADADAISNFENVPGIFKAAFIYENQDQGQARETTRKKLQNKWDQISKENRDYIKDKYDAAMILLK